MDGRQGGFLVGELVQEVVLEDKQLVVGDVRRLYLDGLPGYEDFGAGGHHPCVEQLVDLCFELIAFCLAGDMLDNHRSIEVPSRSVQRPLNIIFIRKIPRQILNGAYLPLNGIGILPLHHNHLLKCQPLKVHIRIWRIPLLPLLRLRMILQPIGHLLQLIQIQRLHTINLGCDVEPFGHFRQDLDVLVELWLGEAPVADDQEVLALGGGVQEGRDVLLLGELCVGEGGEVAGEGGESGVQAGVAQG